MEQKFTADPYSKFSRKTVHSIDYDRGKLKFRFIITKVGFMEYKPVLTFISDPYNCITPKMLIFEKNEKNITESTVKYFYDTRFKDCISEAKASIVADAEAKAPIVAKADDNDNDTKGSDSNDGSDLGEVE